MRFPLFALLIFVSVARADELLRPTQSSRAGGCWSGPPVIRSTLPTRWRFMRPPSTRMRPVGRWRRTSARCRSAARLMARYEQRLSGSASKAAAGLRRVDGSPSRGAQLLVGPLGRRLPRHLCRTLFGYR